MDKIEWKTRKDPWFISVLEKIWMNFQDTGMGMGKRLGWAWGRGWNGPCLWVNAWHIRDYSLEVRCRTKGRVRKEHMVNLISHAKKMSYVLGYKHNFLCWEEKKGSENYSYLDSAGLWGFMELIILCLFPSICGKKIIYTVYLAKGWHVTTDVIIRISEF